MKMNRGLRWAGTGLVLIALIAGLAVGPRVARKVKNIFLSKSTSTPISVVESAEASKETVSGDISLTLTDPSDGLVTSTSDITVSGKTTPNADVAVNDQELKADSKGNFSVKLTLDEGENTITIVANDEQGNYIEKDITVSFVPQK